MRSTIVLFFFLCTLTIHAQLRFEKEISVYLSGSTIEVMCEIPTGGYAIGGSTTNWANAHIIRIDSNGTAIWSKQYGMGSALEFITDLTPSRDGGILACGVTYNSPNNNAHVFVLKVDASGNLLWSRTLGAMFEQVNGWSITELDLDKIVVLASHTNGMTPYAILSCLDNTGNLVWSQAYGGGQMSWIGKLIATSDGGIAVVETIRDSAGLDKIYVLKTDSLGNVRFGREYLPSLSNQNFANGHDIIEVPGKGYLIVGMSGDLIGPVLITMLIDTTGTVVWAKSHNYNCGMVNASIDLTSDSGFVVAFSLKMPGSGYLTKFDSLGNVLWAYLYPGLASNEFKSVITSPNGQNYYIAGNKNTGVTQFLKTDSIGKTGCEIALPWTSTSFTMIVDTNEALFPGLPDTSIWCQASNLMTSTLIYCNLSVSDNNNLKFNLYPNPFQEIVYLEFESVLPKEAILLIYNTLGELVYSTHKDGKTASLDLSFLSTGLYNITIQNGLYAITKRIIKQ